MKLTLDLQGPDGKMWALDMQYFGLPEPYAWEVGTAGLALASYLENVIGEATDDKAKAYRMSLKVVAEGAEPKGVQLAATADRLLYSQAVDIQHQGITLLQRLLQGADMEIKSGQRS